MNVGIIDADLIFKTKHRFPNLVSMKLSQYHKQKGDTVELLLGYDAIDKYDLIYISKVFTDTKVPDAVLQKANVRYGGTGFFYDKAPKLPDSIEHIMPDYHLYDTFVEDAIHSGSDKNEFKYYTDYSIGFLTRGCFRQCEFCVNQNYKRVCAHSPLDEFYDHSRKKICLLDDNFFGYPNWKELILQLQEANVPFQFKQGLDERLLTDEKCELLFRSKYDGEYIFAFDNIADKELIEKKLQLIRKYTNKRLKFYCFCGFDRKDKWDLAFWKQDLFDLFERIMILAKYQAIPYIMRYNRYADSPYYGTYINIAAWCNQPNIFKRLSYREYCLLCDKRVQKKSSTIRYLEKAETEIEGLADLYFDTHFWNMGNNDGF